MILGFNFTVFYLYDAIVSSLSDKAEKKMILQQNKYYDNQLNLMKESLESTRALRHDFKNHISTIYAMAENDNKEALLLYLSQMFNTGSNKIKYANSGNMTIDSIINFKIQEAIQKDIQINHELIIPESMLIPSFDMTIILGNLLDNAINATSVLDKDRNIDIKIWYSKGRMFLKIENTYNGEILIKNNKLITTHLDKENHGIGLENVRKVLEKYDGSMDIKYINNIFSVTVFMYTGIL